MENAPKPGRIELPQSTGKISTPSAPAKTPETSSGAVMDQVAGRLTQQFAARDSQKRYKKAIGNAHRRGQVPTKPEYRISLLEGGLLIGVTLVIDIVEFILGLLAETGIGEVIEIIIDLLVGIAMTGYCMLRLRLSFAANWQIYASLLGSLIAEAIPLINVAAFWTLDSWYIIHQVRKEDRETYKKLIQTINDEQEQEDRQQWIEQYQQQQAQAQLEAAEQEEEEQQQPEDLLIQ